MEINTIQELITFFNSPESSGRTLVLDFPNHIFVDGKGETIKLANSLVQDMDTFLYAIFSQLTIPVYLT